MKITSVATSVTVALLTLALAGTPRPAGAEPAPSAQNSGGEHGLKALGPFIGEWAIDAKWESGEPLKARAVYSAEMGGKHIRTRTFVQKPDGTEYQRYEGVMTWHPRKASLVIYSFAYDGAVQEALAQTDDGRTFRVGFSPFEAGAPTPVRQTLTLVSPDEFEWTVELRVGESDQWRRLIKAPWRRIKK